MATPTPQSTPVSPPSPSPVVSASPLPLTKKLQSDTHVFQTFNNCGPASLTMALSYYGINTTQQQLGQALRPYQNPQGDNDDKSVTLTELAAEAEEHGLTSYHRPAGNMELLQALVAADIPVITRTWLTPSEDIGHYRVVIGYDQTTNELIQDDSLQGNDLRYTYAEFNELWQAFNYEFLVLAQPHQQATVETLLEGLLDEQNAWQRAQQLAQEQLQAEPNDIYAQFNLSVAEYYLGNYQAAITAYEQVDDVLPQRMLWYQIEPILAYYQLGEHQQVLSLTKDILDNNNRAFSELQYLRGVILEQQGQTQAAQAAFDRANYYNTTSHWRRNLDL